MDWEIINSEIYWFFKLNQKQAFLGVGPSEWQKFENNHPQLILIESKYAALKKSSKKLFKLFTCWSKKQ